MTSFIPSNNGLHLTNQTTSLNFSSGVLKQMVNDNTILNSTASQTLGLQMKSFGAGITKFGGVKRKNIPESLGNQNQQALNGHSVKNKREPMQAIQQAHKVTVAKGQT